MQKLWWVLGVLVLVQCSDEESKKESCKLIRQKYAELTYDDEGRVATITQLDINNEPVVGGVIREFEYDNDGRLIQIDEVSDGTLIDRFLLEYSEGQIIQREYFDEDPEADWTITYTLSSGDKIIQLYHESENIESPITYNYEYENGNVVKVTRIVDDVTTGVTELEFDTHPNPNSLTGFELYLGDDIFWYQTQNKNNVTKSTSTPTGGSTTVNTYIYTYNSNGYPTEQFVNGSATAAWFFEYECK